MQSYKCFYLSVTLHSPNTRAWKVCCHQQSQDLHIQLLYLFPILGFEMFSRSHWTIGNILNVNSLDTHLIMVNICISSNDNSFLNSCFWYTTFNHLQKAQKTRKYLSVISPYSHKHSFIVLKRIFFVTRLQLIVSIRGAKSYFPFSVMQLVTCQPLAIRKIPGVFSLISIYPAWASSSQNNPTLNTNTIWFSLL